MIECPYCGQSMAVQGGASDGDEALTEEILRGYDRDFGEGARHGRGEMVQRDWRARERGVWPVEGKASTSYGYGQGAASVIGPPQVYPRHGDRKGAWAPRPRVSDVEWVEAVYPADTPVVSKVRVFETCMAGSTFAVTARDRAGDPQVLLWQAPPRPPRVKSEAAVVEIAVNPPRALHAVRAYVVNDGAQYTQVDTIGLVALDPLPEAKRAAWPKKSRRGLRVVAGLLMLGVGIWFAGRACRHDAAAPVVAPQAAIAGGSATPWEIDQEGLAKAGAVWATHAVASSEYQHDRWAAAQATGAPDVFPVHGDNGKAWASYGTNDGAEWLEVSWDAPVTTRALAVVETFHPGALVRVDDLSGAQPETLWRGALSPSPESRVVRVSWAERRALSRVRLVLDTTMVSGWNEIDAVGAVPTW